MNFDIPSFRFSVPTEIIFGSGVFMELGAHAAKLGSNPLIVTGRRSARESGLLERALEQLPGAHVFDAIDENPDTALCERGARFCADHACDVVVAIGGGSPIDAAKAIAVLARNSGPCASFFGAEKYAHAPLPIVAAPTTAGTGSEVTPYAVIVDAEERAKRTVSGAALFPRIALLDPGLTRSLPRSTTISTGFDALSQALEGIVSKKSTPMGDALALDAIRRVRAFLPAAARGDSDTARAQLLYAAMLSGCVIAQSGTTLVHGMGYHYTLECGIAHGLANALLLTPLFIHNARHAPEKTAAIAAALGASTADPGRTIARSLHELFVELGVSPAARDHGCRIEQLEPFAANVASEPYRYRNQIGEITASTILGFYRQSFHGYLSEVQ
ncbi:MAG: iron-containing alcohol dehydrogenase [Candidatus Hydrogenedentes bacterium]|nr:iron-containing alcohol dehydrogenase [Candidatus Hydrogenedentota bacterium]